MNILAIGRAQKPAVFLEQFQRELVVALSERAVSHHVREQDGGEFALLGVVGGHVAVLDRVEAGD